MVVNAGVANAATGAPGEEDARATAARVAERLALRPEEVVVLSTGVIGPRLPMEKLLAGVDAAAAALSPDGGDAAAEAILTTDNGPKTAVASRDGVTVGGMAKGAGMIHPSLATMLAVVTTDYPLPSARGGGRLPPPRRRAVVQPDLGRRRLLDERCGRPARARAAVDARDPSQDAAFAECLEAVCADLARQIVADGEGATVVLEIAVHRAPSADEARAIALRVATSPLVKTAAFGHDPNWGRVLAAAGSAPWNGGFARPRPRPPLRRVRRHGGLRERGADGSSSPSSAGRRAGSSSISGSATARLRTSPPTSRRTT